MLFEPTAMRASTTLRSIPPENPSEEIAFVLSTIRRTSLPNQ
jgi:hypothetical protein